MAYQSEAQLEKQLISQLSGQRFSPVAIADDGGLVCDLKDVLRGVIGVKEREVRLSAIVTFKYELVAQHFRALED